MTTSPIPPMPPTNEPVKTKTLILLLIDITGKISFPWIGPACSIRGQTLFSKKNIKHVFFTKKHGFSVCFCLKGKMMGQNKRNKRQCCGNLWFFFEIKSYFCESILLNAAVLRMIKNQDQRIPKKRSHKNLKKNFTFEEKILIYFI